MTPPKYPLRYSRPAFTEYFRQLLGNARHERQFLLFLRRGWVVDTQQFKGGRWSVRANLFSALIVAPPDATELVAIHNHPGGNPLPSGMDLRMIRKAITFTFPVMRLRDFIIIAKTRYWSAAQDGILADIYPTLEAERKRRGQ